jgi:DNA mismatch repair protein MutL
VARVKGVTRALGAAEGTEIVVEGGGEAHVRPAGCAQGTSVEVADLFFNVPARRKFLKAVATEAAHVGEAVLLAALARPEVTFQLARDGKMAREYLRVATRRERAAQALGDEKLAACTGERGPMRIEAHLAPPERARAGAVALHLLVNGRPVRDRPLARAVAQAYGSVLEPGRYPVGAVYIDLPPELVDVNVHPQKSEVRFADGRALFDAVTRELHASLAHAFSVPPLGLNARPWLAPNRKDAPLPSTEPSTTVYVPSDGEHASPAAYSIGDPSALSSLAEHAVATAGDRVTQPSEQPPSLFETTGFYASLEFLAQVRAMFLVCEGRDGLYILDQHAAAERVTFDRLRRAFAARAIATQQLLLPEVVELLPAEIAAIEEHADAIALLGVEVRAVGPNAAAVHAVPSMLARARPERILRDLVAELGRAAKRPFGDAADMVLATMACHGSIRAGDAVSREEARALLRALDGIDFAAHCPHGRPVVTRIGFDEMERRVGR